LDFANELAIVGVASRVAECKPVLFYVLLEVHLKANFNSPFLCFFSNKGFLCSDSILLFTRFINRAHPFLAKSMLMYEIFENQCDSGILFLRIYDLEMEPMMKSCFIFGFCTIWACPNIISKVFLLCSLSQVSGVKPAVKYQLVKFKVILLGMNIWGTLHGL